MSAKYTAEQQAELLQEVLGWINEHRVSHDLEPLDAIPKGTHSPFSCPVTNGLNTHQGEYSVTNNHYRHRDTNERWLLPRAVSWFVNEFDAGNYLQFEERP